MSVKSTTEYHFAKKTPCDITLSIFGETYHFTNYESFCNPVFWLDVYDRNRVVDISSSAKKEETIRIIKQLFSKENLKPENLYFYCSGIPFSYFDYPENHQKYKNQFEEILVKISPHTTEIQKTKLLLKWASKDHVSPRDMNLILDTTYSLNSEVEKLSKVSLDNLIESTPLFTFIVHLLSTIFTVKLPHSNRNTDARGFKNFWNDQQKKDEITLSFSNDCFSQNIRISLKLSKTNRGLLYNIFNASADTCSILKDHWPIKLKNEPPTNRLYGLELECTSDHTIKELMDAQDELFMIGKQDGSISGSKELRVELVTVPMTLKAHKVQWSKWFNNLDYNKFDTTKKTTNGIHIHIDRKGFNNSQHIKNFAWFFGNPSNKDFILEFSERDVNTLRQYANFPEFRSSNKKLRTYQEIQSYFPGKYFVVNFQKEKTIEVRLFKGIVSLAEIIKNLEFVDSVVEFTSMEKGVNQLTLKEYIRYLKESPENKYQVLKEYIFKKMEKLKDTLEVSEIKEIIFLETNPKRVTEIINNQKLLKKGMNGFKIADILNKNLGKRVRIFNFDKNKGEIEVVKSFTEGSKLEDINNEVARRFSTKTVTENYKPR